MLTPEEFQALLALLNKAALTMAESLWVNQCLLPKLEPPKPKQESAPKAEGTSGQAVQPS